MRKNLLIFLLLCLLTMGAQAQLKPRVVILTDIGQQDLEPDAGFQCSTMFKVVQRCAIQRGVAPEGR